MALLQQQAKKNGFSMPEVLVSSTILMMIVAGTAQSQLTSFTNTASAGEQNAIQARIAEDLDFLKREAFRWQCTNGTSCSGDGQFEDIPMRYNTSNPELKAACGTQTMAAKMIAEKPSIFPNSSVALSLGNNAPKKNQNMTINRLISADNNEVRVTYTTSGSSKNITTTTSIIPQAASWCA